MGARADENDAAALPSLVVDPVDKQEVASDGGGAASPGSRFGSTTMAFAMAGPFALERMVLPFGAEK